MSKNKYDVLLNYNNEQPDEEFKMNARSSNIIRYYNYNHKKIGTIMRHVVLLVTQTTDVNYSKFVKADTYHR